MIIKCEECGVSFNLDESLLKPSGSKVRCSKCKKVFVAYPPKKEDATGEETLDLSDLDAMADDEQLLDESETEKAQEAQQDEDNEESLDFSTLDSLLEEDEPAPGDDETTDAAADEEESELELDLDDGEGQNEQAVETDEDSGELTLDLDMAEDDDSSGFAAPEAENFELDLDLDLDDDDADNADDDGDDEELDFSALDDLLDEDEEGAEISSDDLELDLDLDSESSVEENESVSSDDEDLELELELDLDLDADDGDTNAGGKVEQEEIDLDELEQTLDMDMLDEAIDENDELDDSELELDLSLEDDDGGASDLSDDVDVSDLEDVLEMDDNAEDDVLGSVVDDIEEDDDFELDFDIDEDEGNVSSSDDMELEFEIDDDSSGEDAEFGDVTEELEESVTVDLSSEQNGEGTEEKVEKKEAVAPVSKTKAGKKKSSKLPIFILILILLAGACFGGYVYWLGSPQPDKIIEELRKKAPILKPLLDKLQTASIEQNLISVVPNSIQDDFINTKDGEILIITGQFINKHKEARMNVGIKGKLLAGSVQFSTSPTFYGGNIIPKKELAKMDLNAINKQLMMNGDRSKHLIQPGGKLPFMIVFHDFKQYPEYTFDYEIIGSTPG